MNTEPAITVTARMTLARLANADTHAEAVESLRRHIDGLRKFGEHGMAAEVNRLAVETGAFPCQWFAGCENAATQLRAHPVLRTVPICDRCDERVEAMS